ncbi:DUF5677 domain-containing protein [Streptomyces sp. NPDC015532]|uniref:DUF5677 domain-containing protein n=1 Tax=Streptomyces sp. NPDC015532 TaxID=3364960 RepID=UPI0036F604FA
MFKKFSRSRPVDDDEFFSRMISDAVMDKVRDGFDLERVDELVSKTVPRFIDDMAPELAASMMRNKRSLRGNKRMERGYNKRMRKQWGRAFDLYGVVHAVSTELGEKVANREREDLTSAQKHTLEALTGLHVSASRIAGEVLALLSQGYPRGALARCRTLHEAAVIACVIADSAADQDHSDLAERFLDHEIVTLRRDALQFQKDHEILGEEPLEQEYLDDLEARYDEVIAKYGQEFRREYGWAKKFSPDDNLRALEEKASLSHVRPHYQSASSEVHCGARGLGRNYIEMRGVTLRHAGKINVDLTWPADLALSSLLQVTFSHAVQGNPDGPTIESLICMRALEEMRSACLDAFVAAQAAIDSAEEKIVKRMQR